MCDYTVLVLSDRWGSPPGTDEKYTSGTEEEYNVARECIASDTHPMSDMLVLFKGVDPKQLSDPGQQLQRVLNFKKTLESEKSLLFATFDSRPEFERHLRRQLLSWAARSSGEEPPPISSNPPPIDQAIDTGGAEDAKNDVANDLVDRADNLAKAGRYVEAESAYATAVVGRRDLRALTKYIRFLRRTGRLDQAVALSLRLSEMAREQSDWRSEIEGLSNIAIVERKKGNLQVSMNSLNQAADIARSAGNDGRKDLAFCLDNLGLTARKMGDFREALSYHLEAVRVREEIDDDRGMANALNHAGALLRQFGQYEDAEEMHRKALSMFRAMEYPRGETQALANLGEDLLSTHHAEEAIDFFEKSLVINRALNSPEGIGMNLWQLGRAALRQDDLVMARRYAADAIIEDNSSGRPEGIAGAYHLMGQVELKEGRFAAAIHSLESAHDSYLDGNHRLGATWTLVDLAEARFRSGDIDGARSALSEAVAAGSSLQHRELEDAIQRASSIVGDA